MVVFCDKSSDSVDVRKMDLNDLSTIGIRDFMFRSRHKDAKVHYFGFNEDVGMMMVGIEE